MPHLSKYACLACGCIPGVVKKNPKLKKSELILWMWTSPNLHVKLQSFYLMRWVDFCYCFVTFTVTRKSPQLKHWAPLLTNFYNLLWNHLGSQLQISARAMFIRQHFCGNSNKWETATADFSGVSVAHTTSDRRVEISALIIFQISLQLWWEEKAFVGVVKALHLCLLLWPFSTMCLDKRLSGWI